jgi:hypothetical protein
MGSIDLSSVSLQDESLDNVNMDDVLDSVDSQQTTPNVEENTTSDTNNNLQTDANGDLNANLSSIDSVSIDAAPV